MKLNLRKVGNWALVIVVAFFALVGLVFTAVFIGMHFGVFNVRGSIADRNASFGTSTEALASTTPCTDASKTQCNWDATPEWTVIDGGLLKDQTIIARVSSETGVSQRMIAAVVIPEQIRFFTSNREIFKSYFEPLKILGSLSMFSLGVSGIKQDTAVAIENFASDTTSSFYPGPGLSEKIAYAPTEVHNTTLFNRLTDDKDHYYSYLYTALYIKEIESQWKLAGYDVTQNPEVITTLFNIGFGGSHPNANPMPGGAPITTGGITYSYGQLGAAFYHSDVLTDVFPK